MTGANEFGGIFKFRFKVLPHYASLCGIEICRCVRPCSDEAGRVNGASTRLQSVIVWAATLPLVECDTQTETSKTRPHSISELRRYGIARSCVTHTKALISMRDVRLSLRRICHPCSSFWCKPSEVTWLIFNDFQLFESNRFHTPLIFLASVFRLSRLPRSNNALSWHLSIFVGWLSWLVHCVDCLARPSQLRCGCATDNSVGRTRGRMHKRFSGFTDGCLQKPFLGIWIRKKGSEGKTSFRISRKPFVWISMLWGFKVYCWF